LSELDPSPAPLTVSSAGSSLDGSLEPVGVGDGDGVGGEGVELGGGGFSLTAADEVPVVPVLPIHSDWALNIEMASSSGVVAEVKSVVGALTLSSQALNGVMDVSRVGH